jgi:hypothetical protein
VVEEVITTDLFQFPTTAARFGSRLAVVNAKFDTGKPPTADQLRGGRCRPLSLNPMDSFETGRRRRCRKPARTMMARAAEPR